MKKPRTCSVSSARFWCQVPQVPQAGPDLPTARMREAAPAHAHTGVTTNRQARNCRKLNFELMCSRHTRFEAVNESTQKVLKL